MPIPSCEDARNLMHCKDFQIWDFMCIVRND
nr:MAG TPA_asm: hypothetical protein [Caudoviricetes sp.]